MKLHNMPDFQLTYSYSSFNCRECKMWFATIFLLNQSALEKCSEVLSKIFIKYNRFFIHIFACSYCLLLKCCKQQTCYPNTDHVNGRILTEGPLKHDWAQWTSLNPVQRPIKAAAAKTRLDLGSAIIAVLE